MFHLKSGGRAARFACVGPLRARQGWARDALGGLGVRERDEGSHA